MDAVELLRHMRGCVSDPDGHARSLCHLVGVKWESTSLRDDQALAGMVDGVPVSISRAEWLPLNEPQGMDLIAQRIKGALP